LPQEAGIRVRDDLLAGCCAGLNGNQAGSVPSGCHGRWLLAGLTPPGVIDWPGAGGTGSHSASAKNDMLRPVRSRRVLAGGCREIGWGLTSPAQHARFGCVRPTCFSELEEVTRCRSIGRAGMDIHRKAGPRLDYLDLGDGGG